MIELRSQRVPGFGRKIVKSITIFNSSSELDNRYDGKRKEDGSQVIYWSNGNWP